VARYDGLCARDHRDRPEEDRSCSAAPRGGTVECGGERDAGKGLGDNDSDNVELRARLNADLDAGFGQRCDRGGQWNNVCERRGERVVYYHACEFRDSGTDVSLRRHWLS
jgi:hypothetical protein